MALIEDSLLEWFADKAKPHKCPYDLDEGRHRDLRTWLLEKVTCWDCMSAVGLSDENVDEECPCIVLGCAEAQRRAVQVIHNMEVGDIFF